MPRFLESLSPAYFGMVMATGIVSIAAHMLGLPAVAQALYYLNIVFFVALWTLNIWRVVRHRREVFADFTDHLRGPGFFTWVAATAVLGAQLTLLGELHLAAWAMWWLALLLWLVFTYAMFAAFTIKEVKPPLERGMTGAWLLAVVAAQSIAVLAALIAMRQSAPWKLELNFVALSMWCWGGMLYIWMMAIIFYRYTFFALSPYDFSPPYWINMGAMAISTLAGSLLIVNSTDAPLLQALLPFIRGFTIFYWATGTWWIPMLVILGAWRYFHKRHPVRYDPLYWAAVFPLGMYSAATHEMAGAMALGFLEPVALAVLFAALAAWLAAITGLVVSTVRR